MDISKEELDTSTIEYVPVLIPTLNRYNHLKACIESLENCVGAEYTELYISVDYPPNSDYEAGHKRVRDYLNNKDFSKFKDIHLFFQETNLGSYENFDFLEKRIKNDKSWFVAIEDDLVFSKNYLLYINKAIRSFERDERFAGVCGYSNFRDIGDEQRWYKGYELTYGSAYNRKIVDFVKNQAKVLYDKPMRFPDFLNLVLSRPGEARIYVDYFIYQPKLYYDKYGNIAPIDYVIHNVFFCNKLFVVTPTMSLVRNMGSDGSGQHSGYNHSIDEYERSKKLDDSLDFGFSERELIGKRNVTLKIKKCSGFKYTIANTAHALLKYALISSIGIEKTRLLITRNNK